jgi:GxxExxY protein
MTQDEFGQVAYEVVGHAFTVHGKLGGIFDESVYRTTLKHILAPRAEDEVRIKLTHSGFEKNYFIDFIVDLGGLFELKAASHLHDRHRQQLIQYLMLTDLRHGKLINFGGEKVTHEFVNCHETTEHRRSFQVNLSRWSSKATDARNFQSMVIDLLRDWGTGLDQGLYHEAITYFLGGSHAVHRPIETFWQGNAIGKQNADLVAPDTAFEITCLRKAAEAYEPHLRRFLINTNLNRIFWVNVVSGEVTFTLLSR